MSRKWKDNMLQALIILSASVTVGILVIIIGFILWKGLPGISFDFLTRQWDDKTTYVNVTGLESKGGTKGNGEIPALGIMVEINDSGEAEIIKIDKNSPVKLAADMKGRGYVLKKKDVLLSVNNQNLKDMTIDEITSLLDQSNTVMKIKVTRPGGGIIPMLVSTVYIIVLSLLIAAPIGILAAVYLNEYAKKGKLLQVIRFAIQNLAGIPSIIYGLFGMLLFVQTLKMQYSILAGSLTLSIVLLPTMISTTEEALKAIPATYRESSLGLGATKLQTLYKVVLPNALPGILVAMILCIGRIVGESAALIFTAGTVSQIPSALTGSQAGAATLTTKLYWLIKESSDLSSACSIAIVILVLILSLNFLSKKLAGGFMRRRGRE